MFFSAFVLEQPKVAKENVSVSFNFECTFEDASLCGMFQSAINDEFDWTLTNQTTPSELTGPSEASSGKYYIYIEASNPRQEGDRARLVWYCETCLEFLQ